MEIQLDGQMKTLKKYGNEFFFTLPEVKQTLEDLFARSGGEGKWRFLAFEKYTETDNWQLKYIRIYKTQLGFVMCDSYNKCKRKQFFKAIINTEYLNHH